VITNDGERCTALVEYDENFLSGEYDTGYLDRLLGEEQ
jgi:hypothetical protein